ncbi:elongation of very long chain fatty acids protein 2 isoform X1 [Cervus canadensis]|uniref:elongation of very long chain fatty acids protein 2 isoform X1 n=1 Tax=Cervus canadensis TaxID=1574408 RepID=UPI001CA347B2|nr:elongation of very long chain fatty acids protein 2 isoform X1 [Cervus canadensis]
MFPGAGLRGSVSAGPAWRCEPRWRRRRRETRGPGGLTQQLSLRRRRGVRPASLPRERQDVSSVRPALSEHPLCAAQGPQPRSEVVSVLGDAGVQETVSPVGQDKSRAGLRQERERQLILSSWEGGYNLQCQDLTSAGEADIRVARVLWWYYFSKLIEFLDTIFFVLRKKTSQITFLHVYHHASMFNIWWCVLNWIPCGQSFFGPTLNSFIHVLMYSYYGLSVFPSMHKHLWWKKYLTQAQLVQFLLTITHTMSAVVRPCGFPFGCLIFQSSYMMTLVILFLNFYIQTYRKKPMKKAMEEAGKEVKNGFSKAYFSAANGVISKKAQ